LPSSVPTVIYFWCSKIRCQSTFVLGIIIMVVSRGLYCSLRQTYFKSEKMGQRERERDQRHPTDLNISYDIMTSYWRSFCTYTFSVSNTISKQKMEKKVDCPKTLRRPPSHLLFSSSLNIKVKSFSLQCDRVSHRLWPYILQTKLLFDQFRPPDQHFKGQLGRS